MSRFVLCEVSWLVGFCFALMQWCFGEREQLCRPYVQCLCLNLQDVVFLHVCSCPCLCARRLTLVFCCDVVELGTYGKLKYYHTMTEEGKSALSITLVIFFFPCSVFSSFRSLDLAPHCFVLVRYDSVLTFSLMSSPRFHWHKCKSWFPCSLFCFVFWWGWLSVFSEVWGDWVSQCCIWNVYRMYIHPFCCSFYCCAVQCDTLERYHERQKPTRVNPWNPRDAKKEFQCVLLCVSFRQFR